MTNVSIAKPFKWFSNKSFKLTLPRLGSKSKASSPIISSPPAAKCSAKEDEYLEVFRFFDSDGDGRISGEELRAYFMSIGECVSCDEAQRVIRDFDTDGDNLLELGDFVRLVERENGGGGDDDDLRRAFEMFEVDKGCGFITPKGVQQVLNRLGDSKSYQECEAMIRVFDLDGNGVLDFHEFHKMMT
ncbi:hypothetical protein RJ639_029608 [Escallonia herrerae]|uniref:EF-hand domain-containing protein n=1 Tax=Escallonia herrerae TaxID=1293975 RepID=A0AA88X2S5_9ASTE|nr:hypothetical protein RJ639_029608 [Escallonia herrerae]